MTPRKRKTPEAELQALVIQVLKLYGVPGLIYLSIPNEGKRAPRTGERLKRMGLLPGAADLLIVLPGGRAHWLELKTPTGTISAEQTAFADLCHANGCQYAVARSPEKATALLAEWGAIPQNPLRMRRAA